MAILAFEILSPGWKYSSFFWWPCAALSPFLFEVDEGADVTGQACFVSVIEFLDRFSGDLVYFSPPQPGL